MASDLDTLTPAESRGLRVRRAVGWWAMMGNFAASVTAMFALADICEFAWIAVALPGSAVSLVLHVRGMRCPRCRRSVFGPPAADGLIEGGEPAVFAPPLPVWCRSCGVGLTAGPAAVPDPRIG